MSSHRFYHITLFRFLPVYSRIVTRSKHSVVLRAGSSEPIELTSGYLARFAAGSVVASQGGNAVLATCVFKPSSSDQGFLPLTVDYRQSAAAVGKIPTNYLRRELSQTDGDIIASRIIDRTIRPLFPKNWISDTQVICKPLSLDDQGDGIILAVNAAGAALHVSEIPFLGPVAAIRLALLGNEIIVNPNRDARRKSSIDMVLAGCRESKTVMIEMDGQEISISKMEEILDQGFKSINEMLKSIEELRTQGGKEKVTLESASINEKMLNDVQRLSEGRLEYILTDSSLDKITRDQQIREVGNEVCDDLELDGALFWPLYYSVVKSTLRKLVLETGRRCDGRGITDFRPITINVDVYKKLHGSALFQRGQTQVFSTVTFDSPAAAFQPDSISQMLGTQQKKMFMHHYEFPAFATNEISSSRGSNRREIGHGALAEKALKHIIPRDFPYTIRLASQVLESNGSSSMASVCAGTLALLDAGVPLYSSAAGVAMGIVTGANPNDNYKILTDLLGIEDYMGDMDFKIAGTKNGFTAMQLDVKIGGLTRKQLLESLIGGKNGVDFVLEKMAVMRATPREAFKSSVPVFETMELSIWKKHILFKQGGFYAKHIEADTGVKISNEDEKNIVLFAPSKAHLEEAKKLLDQIFSMNDDSAYTKLNHGKYIEVEVAEMMPGGVKVRAKDSSMLVFIPNRRLMTSNTVVSNSAATGLKVGDWIKVQYLGVDEETGNIRLSRRTLRP